MTAEDVMARFLSVILDLDYKKVKDKQLSADEKAQFYAKYKDLCQKLESLNVSIMVAGSVIVVSQEWDPNL
jgi:uncharacterized protein YaaR (DUF327 family)